MSHDANDFTEDELAAMRQGWRELIGDRAHGGKMHYSMPPVRGMAPPGSFRLPRDVIIQLGHGDPQTGGSIAHQLFGIEDDPDDPTVVHPHAVRIIGNGNLAAGRRVLERFVAKVRSEARYNYVPQPDGNHGRIVRQAR